MKCSVKRLPNGLTVMLRESHAAPVVACQMWVRVGGADERPDEAGLAHVLEHMVFKGTERRGVGEITRDVELAGGQINAWTSHDETVFHVTMASRYRYEGLEVLLDAVQHAALDPVELEREITVIREEIRMSRDRPQRVATELLFGEIFREHPYGRPVIGSDDTVSSFTRDEVRRFHRRWYVPSNMVLAVVGDFETESMLRRVGQLVDRRAPKRVPRRPARPTEPAPRGIRIADRVLPVSEVTVAMGFPLPGLLDPDVPALDLLTAIAGQGASSRLETEVRRRQGLVDDVRAVSFTPMDAGVLVVFFETSPERLSRAVRAVAAVLGRLAREPVSRGEIERARALLRADMVYAEQTAEGTARKLGYHELHSGGFDFEGRYMAAIGMLDPADLLEAARGRIRPSAAAVAAVVPDPTRRPPHGEIPWISTADGAPFVDEKELRRSLSLSAREGFADGAATPRRSAGPDGTISHVLSNGDVVLVRPDPRSRVVAVRAAYLGGQRYERSGEPGSNTLLASCWTRGTRRRSAEEVSRRMDDLACSIGGFSGRNTVGLQGEFLSRSFASGFALLAECLRLPSLAEEEVSREREIQMEDAAAAENDPGHLAFDLFQRRLFGRHPYGRPILGDTESLGRIGPDSLRRLLARTTGSGRMVMAVVGGADPESVFELAEEHLGGSPGAKRKARDPSPWKPPRRLAQVRRHLPKEQSHVVVGFPGTTVRSEDRFSVEVLTEILGGHGGRLFAQVREAKGLAYAVTAVCVEGIEPGYVALYAATSPGQERRIVDAMVSEVLRLRSERPKAQEVRRVRRHLVGTRAVAAQRAVVRAADMAMGELYGLGPDVDELYPRRIGEIAANDVVEAARAYLDPSRMIVSCVGPGAESLDLLGPTRPRGT